MLAVVSKAGSWDGFSGVFMDIISVINRPGSKAFGLVPRKVVFRGVLILPPPPASSSCLVSHDNEYITQYYHLSTNHSQYVMCARVMKFTRIAKLLLRVFKTLRYAAPVEMRYIYSEKSGP